MTKTSTDYMRDKKKRDQEAATAAPDGSYVDLRTSFFEGAELDANYSNVEIALALAGIEAPRFEDDSGPEACALEDVLVGVHNPFSGAQGSIGRAEVMIDCLIDAASEMASIVNAYKRHELNSRLSELAQDDSISRSKAIEDATTINKKLDQLKKQVRRSFPQWRVTGE